MNWSRLRDTLFLCLFSMGWLWAQDVSSCEVEYQPWRVELESAETEIQPGSTVWLNDLYLEQLRAGAYDQAPAELRQYTFVRPASKKEIRKGRIKGSTQERVGPDGNVYIDVPLPSRSHFFQATPAFEGQFQPQWRRQEMLLPIGVAPVDITGFSGQPLTVLARETDYLLLGSAGKQIVFYRGFPPLGDVFDTEGLRQQLSKRQLEAERWIGRQLLFRQANEIVAPPVGDAGAWVWADNLNRPHEVQDVLHVDRRSVKLAMVDQRVSYLLSDTSQLHIFDLACVDAHKEAHLDSLRRVFSRQEVQLEAFASLPRTDWLDNGDLKRHLAGRFGPVKWPDPNPTYRYLLQPVRSTQPHVYPQLDANGNCWLVSHYLSEKGLYHTSMAVSVGRKNLATGRISTVDERNRRRYRGQQVVEEIAFSPTETEAMMALMARAGESQIQVRFVAGGDFFQEVRLPAIYRSAIRDAWMWAQILQDGE